MTNKTAYLLHILLIVSSSLSADYEEIFYHEVKKAEISVVEYSEPVVVELNLLSGGRGEAGQWLDSYLEFKRLDIAVYDSWIETMSQDYAKSYGVTEELFQIGKEKYDVSAKEQLVGRYDIYLYEVYFKIDERELCRVVGVSSNEKYLTIEEALEEKSGFFTLFFEKLEDKWRMQIPNSGTWIDKVSLSPKNISAAIEVGHFVDVKNFNKLVPFEIEDFENLQIDFSE